MTVDSGSSMAVNLVVHDTTHQGAINLTFADSETFDLEAEQPDLQRPLDLDLPARGRRVNRHGDHSGLAVPEARDVLRDTHGDRRPDLRVLLPEDSRPELTGKRGSKMDLRLRHRRWSIPPSSTNSQTSRPGDAPEPTIGRSTRLSPTLAMSERLRLMERDVESASVPNRLFLAHLLNRAYDQTHGSIKTR